MLRTWTRRATPRRWPPSPTSSIVQAPRVTQVPALMTQVPPRMAPATRLRRPATTQCRIQTPRAAPARVSLKAKPSSVELKVPKPPSPARSKSRQPPKPSRAQTHRQRSPRQRQARRPQAKGLFLQGHRPETSMYLLCSFCQDISFHPRGVKFLQCNELNPA